MCSFYRFFWAWVMNFRQLVDFKLHARYNPSPWHYGRIIHCIHAYNMITGYHVRKAKKKARITNIDSISTCVWGVARPSLQAVRAYQKHCRNTSRFEHPSKSGMDDTQDGRG